MFEVRSSIQNLGFFFLKNIKITFLAIVLGFLILFSVLIFLHFDQKKKAMASAQLAIGFAYLDEGNKDLSLYYFQETFNKSKDLYQLIAGVGVAKALSEIPNSGIANAQEKIINVLSIVKSYKKDEFISTLLNGVYFSNTAEFSKGTFKSSDFNKFEANVMKGSNQTFKDLAENAKLNLQ